MSLLHLFYQFTKLKLDNDMIFVFNESGFVMVFYLFEVNSSLIEVF